MSVIYYMVWGLLPFVLFVFGFWALLRPYCGVRGKESAKQYFVQFFFCTVCLFIAIAIDQWELFNNLLDDFSFEMVNLRYAKWLIYPVVLLLASAIQQLFSSGGRRV